MSSIHHTLGDRNVLIKGLAGSINHHRGVETAVDAVVAGLFIAVVEVDGENSFREGLVSRADEAFNHDLVGIRTCTLANLDDEGGGAVNAAAKQTHGLLKVINVVCADGILAVCGFE